jgi:PAS domain S-box-containing protein
MSRPFPQTLAALFEAAPFGVLIIDEEGVVVYVNPHQYENENSRLRREDFIGKHYRTTFYTTLENQGLLSLYDRLQQTGIPFATTSARYQCSSNGTLIASYMRGYQHGDYTFLFTTMENPLPMRQARYEQLVDNANDGIFILSPRGRFVEFNHTFATLIGLPREEILKKTSDLLLPGGSAQWLERQEQILREGKVDPYELEIVTPLGKKVLSVQAFAICAAGHPIETMHIARDVTAHKRAEEALRESEERYGAVKQAREQQRAEVLSILTRKIETPLEVILGHTETLIERVRDRSAHEETDLLTQLKSSVLTIRSLVANLPGTRESERRDPFSVRARPLW